MSDCTTTDCSVKVFDIIASLYVSAFQYDYSQIVNGRDDGTGTIDDTIIGCGIIDNSDLETLINNICTIYKIERIFSATKLMLYRNVGIEVAGTIVATIKASDLAVTNTSSNGINYEISTTYTASTNSVTQIAFSFIDADNDYKPNQVTAKRPDAIQTDPVSQISLPFIMQLIDAEKLVNRLLNDSRLSLITHTFRLPPKYAWIGKGDVIELDHGEFADTVRITDTDFNADKSQSVTAVTVGSKSIPIATTPHASTVPVVGGDLISSIPVYLDIPAPDPLECSGANVFEMYQSVTPASIGYWLGAYIARKLEDDPGYETIAQIYGQAERAGSCILHARATNALKDKPWVTDSDTLSLSGANVTWDTALNRTKAVIDKNALLNVAVYGNEGRWELIQFESIVDNVMSGIVRGLRGTDVNCGKHLPNDYIITFFPAMSLTRLPFSQVGKAAKYRGVSEGQAFISVPQIQALPFQGNSRRPFAPYRFEAVRESDGDITIAWTRRDRVGSGWGKALVNSESMLAFSVNICTPAGVVLRNLAATDTSVVYTSDAQSSDASSGMSSFLILAKQIGDIGPGFEGKGLVNV